jgi:uncharacterized protein
VTADPLRVPVAELRRRVGTRRTFVLDLPLDLVAIAGTEVPAGDPIHVELVLESVLEGVVVAGEVRAPWTSACRRCLDTVAGTVGIPVRELFEHDPTPGETYPIEDDHIDLDPLVRDAVLLALPLSPLCSADCPGPDPERYPARVEGDEPPPSDPRWAALRDLRFED